MASHSPHARPDVRFTEDGRAIREVLSYSRRGTRLTQAQQAAWDANAEAWLVTDASTTDWSAVFGRSAPLVVEIGSGVGETAVAVARQRPEASVLAFEVWLPGVADTLERAAKAGVANLRVSTLDAAWAMEHLLAADSVVELLTFFPDPWHKKRHHKRRLVSPGFAALAASRLEPGAVWRLATDWPDYAEWIREVLDAEPSLEGGPAQRWEGRPLTRFERRGIRSGRPVADFAYTKGGG